MAGNLVEDYVRRFHSNGRISEEYFFKNKRRNGLFIVYDDNGNKKNFYNSHGKLIIDASDELA